MTVEELFGVLQEIVAKGLNNEIRRKNPDIQNLSILMNGSTMEFTVSADGFETLIFPYGGDRVRSCYIDSTTYWTHVIRVLKDKGYVA